MTSFGLLARLTRRPESSNSHAEEETIYHAGVGSAPICNKSNQSLATQTETPFSPQQQQPHDARYYAACYLAGGLSSSIRWVLSPIELVKTRLQTAPLSSTSMAATTVGTPFRSLLARKGVASSSSGSGMMSTLSSIYVHEGGIRGLFRGVGPTAAAYWFQTSTKYGLYEVLKDQLSTSSQAPSRGWTYVLAAATAEAIADVLMCPWEMVKVQLQTTSLTNASARPPSFPSRFGPALWEMMTHRRHYNFPFGSLGPLWGRQIPGTVVNFYTFEHAVQFIYRVVGDDRPKEDYTTVQQLGVTLCAGNVAGVACALVSHPADSIISLRALPAYAGHSVGQIVRAVGWYRLATRGLLPRILVTGQIISMQWLLYDSFKSLLGLGTSGGSH